MRIMITGSSGQIGTNLAIALINVGHDVIGVDCRENQWSEKIETWKLDLTEKRLRWPSVKPDLIVHLAAHAKVHDSVVNPALAVENYSMGLNVLEYAGAQSAALILGSSREVYGHQFRMPVHEKNNEGMRPCSPYAEEKRNLEIEGQSRFRKNGLPVVSLRFSNVFGRYDTDIERLERVIPLFIKMISKREKITIYDENKRLDFTHVDDCVSGIVCAINAVGRGAVNCGEFNISSGKSYTLGDLVTVIESHLALRARKRVLKARTGEISKYCADLSEAAKSFGYKPNYDLISGLKHTWSCYQPIHPPSRLSVAESIRWAKNSTS